MPKKVEITCDHCGKDLSGIDRPSNEWCLRLSAEQIPYASGFNYAMMFYPPISRDCYFCNLSCMSGWLTKRALDASPCTGTTQ